MKNLKIEELPEWVDDIINGIGKRTGKTKKEMIRDAIIEYAERHCVADNAIA